MKKLLALLMNLMIFIYYADAQQPGYKWAKGVGGDHITGQSGPFDNILRHFYTDKKGNSYIAGEVIEGVSFGDSVLRRPYGSFGTSDIVLAKYDKCGKLVWHQIVGSKMTDVVNIFYKSYDESYLLGRLSIRATSTDSVILHLENKDTVIKGIWSPYVKINASNGKILQYWSRLQHATGAFYTIFYCNYISPNRMICYVASMTGNYNGITKSGYEFHIAMLDSNLNIIKLHQIDSGLNAYYDNDYAIPHPEVNIDKYCNIYSEVIHLPSNPSNVLRLFDTTFTGLSRGEGIFYQLDTNLNLKRFKKENCMIDMRVAADDNLYMAGGTNSTFFYDNTYLTGSSNSTYRTPFYMKIDTSLNLVGYSYTRLNGVMQYLDFIQASTNKVYVGGVGFDNVKWGQDSIVGVPNTYEMVIWEFPKDSVRPSKAYQGKPFGINTVVVKSAGVDEQGNVNIGGTYNYILYTEGDTIAARGGSNSPNIFTMHWGLDCTDSTHALVAPLPATALTATAASAHAIHVDWSDASHYEHGYHVYRSADGISGWALIDSTGANTSQFIDAAVQPNTVYWYRVSAWNESGESSVSNADSARTWMEVGLADASPSLPYITAYPNPATDRLTVEVYSLGSREATLALTDISGRIVSEQYWQLNDAMNSVQIDIQGMATGIYYLTINTTSDNVTKRVIKM